jgi:hypothetical protein
MSADKRTVATDALATLGMIHDKQEKRDAIHLAVIQVRAAEDFHPGDSISAINDEAFSDPNGLGIVDPFINSTVLVGESFWMIIKPRLITSLRHVWEHPAFDNEAE